MTLPDGMRITSRATWDCPSDCSVSPVSAAVTFPLCR